MKRSITSTLVFLFCFSGLIGVVAEGHEDVAPKDSSFENIQAAPKKKYYSFRNISYTDDDDERQLNLYMPVGKEDVPVVVFFPGGGWRFCRKSDGKHIADIICEKGYGVASVEYRTVGLFTPKKEERYPRFVEDGAAAFAWVKSRVKKFGGDPDQLFVAGHSAGGHMAAMLATDESFLKEHELESKVVIKGCICFSGVYEIPEKVPDEAANFARLIDAAFPKDKEAREKASPKTHVGDHCPTFLLLYADDDYPLLDVSAEAFKTALAEEKIDAESHEIEGYGHISLLYSIAKGESEAARLIVKFLDDACASDD